jgi:hypothetical protein
MNYIMNSWSNKSKKNSYYGWSGFG